MDSSRLGQRFGHFVRMIFQAEGFQVDVQPKDQRGVVPDLLVRSRTGVTAIVETKLYRSHVMPVSALAQAALNIEFYRQSFRANRAIIVLGSKITPLAREALKQFPELMVYDIGVLAFLVARHPNLIETFEEITREAIVFSETIEPEPVEVDIEADLTRPVAPVSLPLIERRRKGDDLCNQIREIGSGRPSAKRFEEKMTEALRYIFEKDLTAWSPQKATDTRLSYYDLVARVPRSTTFGMRLPTSFVPDTSCSNSKTI